MAGLMISSRCPSARRWRQAALRTAAADFERWRASGTGRGMSCFSLKGGIGTASRRVIPLAQRHARGAGAGKFWFG
ncbi:P1 family peptidase [Pantoea ananatis]